MQAGSLLAVIELVNQMRAPTKPALRLPENIPIGNFLPKESVG